MTEMRLCSCACEGIKKRRIDEKNQRPALRAKNGVGAHELNRAPSSRQETLQSRQETRPVRSRFTGKPAAQTKRRREKKNKEKQTRGGKVFRIRRILAG
jgi:hypothetical protein